LCPISPARSTKAAPEFWGGFEEFDLKKHLRQLLPGGFARLIFASKMSMSFQDKTRRDGADVKDETYAVRP
jgi:hypothetical protein